MSKSLAIAYSMKKKAKKCNGGKMASGGMVKSGDPEMDYAKGGEVKGVHKESLNKGMSKAGEHLEDARMSHKEGQEKHMNRAKEAHEMVLEELKSMPSPKLKAHGGEVNPMQEVTCPHCTKSFSRGGDVRLLASAPDEAGALKNARRYVMNEKAELVDSPHGKEISQNGERVRGVHIKEHKGRHRMEDHRSKMGPGYSEGGMIANDTGEGFAADEMPNEFDDLVLRDSLEENYTGANSGDELGGPDKDDLVSRAMLRKKAKR